MDMARIEALIEVAKGAAVSEVTVKSGNSSVSVKKAPVAVTTTVGAKKPVVRKQAEEHKPVTEATDTSVHAPMVGIFHAIDGISKGVKVKKGQVLGAIESMKLMNEIRSEDEGIVEEFFVEDGMPVEYGQALVKLGSRE
jgi:acetyl-CoA carboxylase biotin carboxyl carrier protein